MEQEPRARARVDADEVPASPPRVDRPIFIVGDGRSGTTLMRTLLAAHPRIAVTPETQYMARAEAEGGLAAGAPPDFEAFWQRYTSWVRFEDLGVDAGRCLSLVDLQGERTFRSVFVAVLAAYRDAMGKARVGEKSPGHVFYLHHLFRWFPDARVLVLRRDPRAVVASKMRTPWVTQQIRRPSPRTGLLTATRLHAFAVQVVTWRRVYEEHVPAWEHDERVRIVAYEDLVRDPTGEVRAVCAFLDEPFDAELVSSRERAGVPGSAGRAPDADLERWRREHEARALEPVSADSLEKWREQLRPLEVAMVEGWCATGMRAGGYRPSTSRPRRAAGRAAVGAVIGAGRVEELALPAMRRAVGRLRRVATGNRPRPVGPAPRDR